MIIMVVTSLLAAATVLWIQGRFEHADERNALTIVQEYRSRAGVTVPALLSSEYPGRPVQWRTQMKSSCFQHIEVVAQVAKTPGAPPQEYAFSVDLNGPSIHPANEAGKTLLAKLDTPLPAPPASASASAVPPASAIPASAVPAARASATASAAAGAPL